MNFKLSDEAIILGSSLHQMYRDCMRFYGLIPDDELYELIQTSFQDLEKKK